MNEIILRFLSVKNEADCTQDKLRTNSNLIRNGTFTSGVLVIDYKNQLHDGDFAPNPACYPSVKALSSGVKEKINATLMFSFWPEAPKHGP